MPNNQQSMQRIKQTTRKVKKASWPVIVSRLSIENTDTKRSSWYCTKALTQRTTHIESWNFTSLLPILHMFQITVLLGVLEMSMICLVTITCATQ